MKAQIFNKKFWIKETDPDKLDKYFNNLLKESGFKVAGFINKYFEPFGYTSLYLLCESHLAIHTFPEENKTYIELSSCVIEQFDKFVYLLKDGNKIPYKEIANG